MLDLWIFIFGLVMGSFVNVCIHRLPREESVVTPPSHCPSCGKGIRPYDNIPLISFMLLLGRCRFCRTPISIRYFLVELIHGGGALLILRQFGFSPESLVYFLFFAALITITCIDLDHQIIPDLITLPGIGIGLIASSTLLPSGPVNAIIGLLLGGGLFYLVAILSVALLKKEGMGGGDIKLIAMIGAFLGWKAVLLTIFIAALFGSVIGLFLIGVKGRNRAEPIPFGPFLALGAMISLFWGHLLLQIYLSIGS